MCREGIDRVTSFRVKVHSLLKTLSCFFQGVNPWIEVDGGVTPANAYKVKLRYSSEFHL